MTTIAMTQEERDKSEAEWEKRMHALRDKERRAIEDERARRREGGRPVLLLVGDVVALAAAPTVTMTVESMQVDTEADGPRLRAVTAVWFNAAHGLERAQLGPDMLRFVESATRVESVAGRRW
jgi:hypothetical protein